MRRALRQHHHLGADGDAAEQVGDVFIGQANAARGDELADGRGIVGAVNPVDAGAEIHGARAERIAGAARHEARQIGLARDHFRRRMPIRPLGLPGDRLHAGPGKTLAAYADAVANRAALAEHVIEVGVAGIDHDGARRFVGIEGNDGALQPLRHHGRAVVAVIGGLGRRDHHVIRGKRRRRVGGIAEHCALALDSSAGDSISAVPRTSAPVARQRKACLRMSVP